MPEIQKLDPNFYVSNTLTRNDVTAYDVSRPPFRVYGLLLPQNDEDCFRRMPLADAKRVSAAVEQLHRNTAGGRVRFATDSGYFAIHAQMQNVTTLPHMPLTGTVGFDLYCLEDGKERYVHTFRPMKDMPVEEGFRGEFQLPDRQMREYTLNFPLYSDVKRLHLLLDQDARVEPGADYANELPIVFYGSSITQGGCASRPGNSYESMISQQYNWNFLNLGFSGNAKGEPAMAEYIAGLKMSAFVLDYDYNAPDLPALQRTHEPFFKIVRAANPQLPILCISKIYSKTETDRQRRDVIRQTVENARASGDPYTYFLDGGEFEQYFNIGGSITVDGVHPNDLGFYAMAQVIGQKLNEVTKATYY